MQDTELLQQALFLESPWQVHRCAFDGSGQRLDIHITFAKGSRFPCPQCEQSDCPAYDSQERTWRHLNFFQHLTYLHVRTPRIDCPRCGIKIVAVPWARVHSGFTLLLEKVVVTLAKHMPVLATGRFLQEYDTRLWRILTHYVEEARKREDFSQVSRVAVDETSSRRGHRYITLFVDSQARRVLFATEGKDAGTIQAFKADLRAHHGKVKNLREVCLDLSPAFREGLAKAFPRAKRTFDRYHTVRLVNEALDQVRRQEQKVHPELKGSRYLWLKNPGHLSGRQQERLEQFRSQYLETAKAYRLKLTFQDLYWQMADHAVAYLRHWCDWAAHSGLEPFRKLARTIHTHRRGILRWFHSKMTNGLLEGINSLVQAAKAKARGYRSIKNLITMVYLIAGKLDFGWT